MKKNQAKILARTIYQLIKNQNKAETEKLTLKFVSYLAKHHLIHLTPKILAELEQLHLADANTVVAKVESQNKLSVDLIKTVARILHNKLDKKIKLDTSINQDLLGGMVIQYDDKIIDLSLKKQLNNLKQQLSN